jgi:hypothetical protein
VSSPESRQSRKVFGLVVAGVIFLAGLVTNDVYDWTKRKLFPTRPVTISLELDPATWEAGNPFGGESYEWVFPAPPSILRPPPEGPCYRRYRWGHGLAGSSSAGALGVEARTTRFRLTIQSGNAGQSVLLQRIVPVIYRRLPNDAGTLIACPAGGASANLRRLAVDLDRATALFTDGENNPLPLTMLKFGLQESEPIMVVATAERGHYDWSLRLDFIIDGKPSSTFINRGNGLFATTGVSRARTFHWAGSRWSPGEGAPAGNGGL